MLSRLFYRIMLHFHEDKELYSTLYGILGFYPKDIQHYKLALMHKSIMRKEKGKPLNNERLEFLGDAILDAVVGDIVYKHFEKKREGFLTNARSKIVQRDTLNKLANELGITQIILSSGNNTSHNSYLGGNAFEALVGAVYLDRGYEACMKFMSERILTKYINLDKLAYKEVNFKSKLIEWSQKNRVKVEFQLLEQAKEKNGSPKFTYQVVIEGLKSGIGSGYSKKESQQEASKLTLDELRKKPQFIDAVFAAKANRTKMEEMPVENVPDTRTDNDFLITNTESRATKTSPADNEVPGTERAVRKPVKKDIPSDHQEDEFDLSDISAAPSSKEDIIAAAEAAAFAEAD